MIGEGGDLVIWECGVLGIGESCLLLIKEGGVLVNGKRSVLVTKGMWCIGDWERW